MQIQADPPFQLSKDADGQHATSAGVAITVTPDVDAKITHTVGQQPETGNSSRWLHVHVPDGVQHIYINGGHIVATNKAYLPTFEMKSPEQWMHEALKYMRAGKDEQGRYVVDTEQNRRVLATLFEHIQRTEKNRLMSWLRHLAAKICE